MGRPRQTFANLVARSRTIDEHLLIGGTLDKDGYGLASVGGVKMPAHRAAWLLSGGTIPDGLYLLHKCDKRNCINPEHLYVGTQKQNVQDQIDAGTFVRGELSGSALLDDAAIRSIRGSTESTTSLARKLNVSYHTVWDARNFRSWKHVK